MGVKRPLAQHVATPGFSTAPGIKAENYGEGSLRRLLAGTRNIAGNSRTPIHFDPFPLFGSRAIIIAGVFRAGMGIIAEGLDVTV
jgi:hypothetical protein